MNPRAHPHRRFVGPIGLHERAALLWAIPLSGSTLNKLDRTPGQGLDQCGRCDRAWAKAGSKKHDPRTTHAWNYEDRASNSVGYPSFAQFLPYLPHALIVTGDFAEARRSSMRDVNIFEPVKQTALDNLQCLWQVLGLRDFAARRERLFQLLERQNPQESHFLISSSNPSCKQIDPI